MTFFYKHFQRMACLTLLLSALLVTAIANAQSPTVQNVVIKGNERIEAQTIRSYMSIVEGQAFDRAAIDKALKNLYSTGFFADVNLYTEGANLVVEVVENPIINRLAFEGNIKIEDKDLENEVELKPRSIYTRTKIQNDVQRVLDIYRRSGRYSATVEPKVITLDQNRVDLVFEITEGTVAKVQKITILGNKTFNEKQLLGVIRTEEARWYKFLTSDDKYDPDRLLYDQELLRRYYYSQGYADFQVKSAVAELTPDKEAFFLTFVIEEGKKYTFGDVSVKSALKGIDENSFTPFITTHKDDVYNANEVENTIDNLVKDLGNRGFAFVDINPKLSRNGETQTISLVYTINEGPRVYVDRINITGNLRTLDEVVRREFRLAEGDPYNTSKLARTEQRLNNLGFFESVKISNEQGSAPDRTNINVDVQEKSTGELTLGAGFSSVDGALADISVRETNFLGRGQDLKFRILAATERQQYDIGFTDPYFLGREVAAGFDIYKITQNLRSQSSYDRDTNGFNLRTGYALNEELYHSIIYYLKEDTVGNVQPDASLYIKKQEGTTITSGIGHAITLDKRNNKFDPTSGYYLKFSEDIAGLGGDAHFLRHEVKASYYYPVAKDWTFSLLGSAGHVLGLGEDVRINDRFFIGTNELRGFDKAGIGPRDQATGDALGGNVYYATSTELRFPLGLPEEMGILGAVFIDAGSLWDVEETGGGVLDSSALRVSGGFGVSWNSPFGPIRIDLGYPLLKADEDETQIFRFNFGTRF